MFTYLNIYIFTKMNNKIAYKNMQLLCQYENVRVYFVLSCIYTLTQKHHCYLLSIIFELLFE